MFVNHNGVKQILQKIEVKRNLVSNPGSVDEGGISAERIRFPIDDIEEIPVAEKETENDFYAL